MDMPRCIDQLQKEFPHAWVTGGTEEAGTYWICAKDSVNGTFEIGLYVLPSPMCAFRKMGICLQATREAPK